MTTESNRRDGQEGDPLPIARIASKPRNCRFPLAISLRSLMLGVLLIGIGLGWMIHRVEVQRDAAAVLEQAGFTIRYQWGWSESPFASKVRRPGLSDTRVSDDAMVDRSRLSMIQTLYLGRTEISNTGLLHLSALMRLRSFSAKRTLITPAGVDSLKARLPKISLIY